jgi:hypothetical protein
MDQDKLHNLRDYYDHDNSVGGEDGVWETDTEDDPMVTTSFRIRKSLLDWVRAQAESQDIKPTALIRRWIEDRHNHDDARSVTSRLNALEAAVYQSNRNAADRSPGEPGSSHQQSASALPSGYASNTRTVHRREPTEDQNENTTTDLLTALQRSVADRVAHGREPAGGRPAGGQTDDAITDLLTALQRSVAAARAEPDEQHQAERFASDLSALIKRMGNTA